MKFVINILSCDKHRLVILLVINLALSSLLLLFAQDDSLTVKDELEKSFIEEGITTRIYRSTDNIDLTVKKMSFADSAFKDDVFSKDDFINKIFQHSIRSLQRRDGIPQKKVVDSNLGIMLFCFALILIVVLFLLFKICKHFKI